VPWTFEDHNNADFIVKDASSLAVAYVTMCKSLGVRQPIS